MTEQTGKERKPYIAHWRKAKNENYYIAIDENGQNIKVDVQLLIDHLKNTSEFAAAFADCFGASEYAAQMGLAHDIGKYSSEFQKRIWENAPKVDHSTAGAKEVIAINDRNLVGMAAAYCIAGHHAGLLNGGSIYDSSGTVKSLYARLNKELPDYNAYRTDIKLEKLQTHPRLNILGMSNTDSGMFSVMLWIRMLFSCLVDADYLDTELFMKYGECKRDPGETMISLLNRLNRHIKEKNWLQGENRINRLRSGILQNCINKGTECKGGILTLTVPTGGGKTVASLAFALNHAVKMNKKRIIYVIPYCSIIDQTVDVFTDILGERNVLAHYSNIDITESTAEDDIAYSKELATENWEKPIVVTTAVQFFESLFADKTSQCRKLHNVADSVIIFDEAQTLPQPYLKPCIAVISELVQNYDCTCVLCTATQPALNRFFEKIYINHKPAEMKTTEICEDTEKLYKEFKRVTYKMRGRLDDEELAEELMEQDQVLCVVVTRKQAYNVYHLMSGEGNYHLSKCMTSKDIRDTLAEIRIRLETKKTCRVIATNLVEAGVDLDFRTVYRAKAGLDSIIQAGGRCNREGKNTTEESIVYIFDPEDRYLTHLPNMLKRPALITEVVTKDVVDMAEQKVVSRYFNNLFNHLDGETAETSDGLDVKRIMHKISECQKLSFPFADIARDFKLIDNQTVSVLIPSDETSHVLSEKLQNAKECMNSDDYRKIGKYCVNIYAQNLKALRNSVIMISDDFAILAVEELYDKYTGLKMEDEGGNALFS